MQPSKNNVWKAIPGWCTDIEGDHLYRLAKGLLRNQHKHIILDLGTYFGRSAGAFGLGCKEARVITVDNFEGNPEHQVKPSFAIADMWLARLGVKDHVTIVESDAVEFCEKLDKSVHVVYIDTKHDYQSVLDTFLAAWPRLASKGDLLFHDSANTGWKEVVRAVDTIAGRWPIEQIAVADSIRHFRKLT